MVGGERSSGKAGEIEDDGQEQDFAVERQAVPGSPKPVQPKDQPTGNGDCTQDKKRKGNRAVHKKRIEKLAEHFGRSLAVAELRVQWTAPVITARTIRQKYLLGFSLAQLDQFETHRAGHWEIDDFV